MGQERGSREGESKRAGGCGAVTMDGGEIKEGGTLVRSLTGLGVSARSQCRPRESGTPMTSAVGNSV